MADVTGLITQIPPMDVPFIDARTGRITEAWWFFLLQLYRRTGNNTGGDGQMTKSDIISFDQTFGQLLPNQQSDFSTETIVPNLQSQYSDYSTETIAPVLQPQTIDYSSEMTFAPQSAIDGVPLGFPASLLTASATGVALATTTWTNVTSLSLSPGDWDLTGVIIFTANAGATISGMQVCTSTTSAAGNAAIGSTSYFNTTFTTATPQALVVPTFLYSVSVPTTVYLEGLAVFAGGTATIGGFIRARRIR